MNAISFSRPAHLDREARMIRIEALQDISFKSRIARDKAALENADEDARDAVEGIHQRVDVARQFKGSWHHV